MLRLTLIAKWIPELMVMVMVMSQVIYLMIIVMIIIIKQIFIIHLMKMKKEKIEEEKKIYVYVHVVIDVGHIVAMVDHMIHVICIVVMIMDKDMLPERMINYHIQELKVIIQIVVHKM